MTITNKPVTRPAARIEREKKAELRVCGIGVLDKVTAFVGSAVKAISTSKSALLAECPRSFTCHSSNTGVERAPNKSQHTQS